MKKPRFPIVDLGWQSWSPCPSARIHIPLRNYAPHPYHPLLYAPVAIPKRRMKKPVTGWCTWQAYGTHIDEEKILSHADFITEHRLPLTYILIDDGWTTWGNWLTPDRDTFPHGMRWLAQRLTHMGLRPGLWIAPFLVDPDASLARRYPAWLVRDSSGNPVDGRKITPFDRNMPYRKWILDLARRDVREYLFHCIHTIVHTWGFQFLKLDFLYAQHFHPTYRASAIPDRLLKNFLSRIKTRYPSVHIAACGCPLAPAVGVVDSMRISEDIINPQLRGTWPLNSIIHTRRLRQLMQNLRVRKWTNRYWLLDPDALVTNPLFGFSREQIRSLRDTIRTANGLMFLGDNLLRLERKTLRSEILPLFHEPYLENHSSKIFFAIGAAT